MALLDQDEELLAKLREETAGRSEIELPPVDLTQPAAPLGGQQVSPGFGVLEAQQGLPSAAAEAPLPSVAEIIKSGIAKQTEQKKPSRLEQLASAIKSGGEAVGDGLGRVGAGIGQALGGGTPADDDGYNRVGAALYAAGTGQRLPADFFKRGKPEDKEMLGLEKDLRRAQILKALRGEPVKPVDPNKDPTTPYAKQLQDHYTQLAKQYGVHTPELEAVIRSSNPETLNSGSNPVTLALRPKFSTESGERGAQRIVIAREGSDRAERKFDYEKASDLHEDVTAVNKGLTKDQMRYQINAMNDANDALGGILQADTDAPINIMAEDAFDLPSKVNERLKFLPSLALKKLQGEFEVEKARNPNAKTSDIEKRLLSKPEYAEQLERLRIATKTIENIITHKLYGSALSEQEAGRAKAMLGTEWGQTPAGRIYVMRLLARAMDQDLRAQSSLIKEKAEESGRGDKYNNYVKSGAIYEGVWKSKPQPAKQEKKPIVSPLDRPSNPADKGPQVPVPEGMPEVTTQVSEPTPAQLDELASGNKKQIIRVKPKAREDKATPTRTLDSLKAAGFKRQLRKSDGAVVWRNPTTGEIVEAANVQ